MRILKIFSAFVILAGIPSLLAADVIRLQNGQIIFGKVISVDPDGIVVESSGKQCKFRKSEILKTEKDFSTLKNQQSEINLKDGFGIKGKILNYNVESGMLVNFGSVEVTLPVQNIHEINDPIQKKYYTGNPVLLGISGGYYSPVGDTKNSFSSGYNISLFSEFRISLIRGLSIGGDLSYFPLNYKNDSSIDYSIFTFQPYLIYHFFFLQQESSFLRNLVPFVSAGLGAGYVLLKDKRDNASAQEKSEIDFAYSIRLGCDFRITENIIVRLNSGWQSVMQKSYPFNAILINGGLIYSF